MNMNSPPLPFPSQKFMDDHCLPDPIRSYHPSSMASCHNFFKSCQDRTEDYDRCEFGHLKGQPDGNYTCSEGGSRGLMIKDTVESDLELSLWKKEDQGHSRTEAEETNKKSMSSKMRLMEKIKNPTDRITLNLTTALTTKLEDHQKPQLITTHPETDQLGCNNSLHHNSSIRVCSDCNTTKTPLWRSGPKGPKSLCNACGIRQRKARRAMAAAAAANGNGCTAAIGANMKPPIKVHREKTERNLGRRPHASQIKKRCKAAAAVHDAGRGGFPRNNGPPKRRFEDLLINLSKKLAIHRVFPEDEKDAAILLMALSYGLVHG